MNKLEAAHLSRSRGLNGHKKRIADDREETLQLFRGNAPAPSAAGAAPSKELLEATQRAQSVAKLVHRFNIEGVHALPSFQARGESFAARRVDCGSRGSTFKSLTIALREEERPPPPRDLRLVFHAATRPA